MSFEKIETRIKIPTDFIVQVNFDISKSHTGWIVEEQMSGYGYNHIYQIYQYYVNGCRQSVDNRPSYIETLAGRNDKIYRLMWHDQNKKHRIDGPAVMYLEDHQDEYYLNDFWIPETDYWESPAVIEYKLDLILEL